jgi:hypothetical protein
MATVSEIDNEEGVSKDRDSEIVLLNLIFFEVVQSLCNITGRKGNHW